MKTDDQKNALLEQLKKTPIVQIACERIGIGRSSYYRWRKENPEFAKSTDEAITEGELLITDMSESQLISLIRDKNFPAIQLWLRHHHPKYGNKLEVSGNLRVEEKPLSPEQQNLVAEALRLVGLENKQNNEQKNDQPESTS